jgi:hypothetical protein
MGQNNSKPIDTPIDKNKIDRVIQNSFDKYLNSDKDIITLHKDTEFYILNDLKEKTDAAFHQNIYNKLDVISKQVEKNGIDIKWVLVIVKLKYSIWSILHTLQSLTNSVNDGIKVSYYNDDLKKILQYKSTNNKDYIEKLIVKFIETYDSEFYKKTGFKLDFQYYTTYNDEPLCFYIYAKLL